MDVDRGMTFEQLCGLFVKSLLDKAHAYAGPELTKFQRSRLGESMTADIRKLGDMVFPAARRPLISSAAKAQADSLGHDLRRETWHSQKAIDGYKVFTYEHLFPVRQIRAALGRCSDVDDALDVIDQMLWVAWITKDEDKRLSDLGFTSSRPDPYFAYEKAGIELVVDGDDAQSDAEAIAARMRLVLNMVGVLHRRGFERLRIVPGFSGSGMYWRCSFAPDTNIVPEPTLQDIDQIADHEGLVVTWSNANPRVFGDPNASHMNEDQLADAFAVRFPALLTGCKGSDSAYAAWFADLLNVVRQGFFPVFYGDYLSIENRRTPVVGQSAENPPQLALPPAPKDRQPGKAAFASRFVWRTGDIIVTPPPDDASD